MKISEFSHQIKSNNTALTNFAFKLSRNTMDAEDLVQEAVFKAFKGLHTFKDGTSFKSWIFTILKNTFITKYHKRKKRGVVNAPIEEFTYALENNYATRNNAISQLKIKEIEACIDEISYKSKMPFLMHTEGYQYNEIADSLDIPIGTVKSRINYARTKIKVLLKQRGLMAA